jgi:hypothetical protein
VRQFSTWLIFGEVNQMCNKLFPDVGLNSHSAAGIVSKAFIIAAA